MSALRPFVVCPLSLLQIQALDSQIKQCIKQWPMAWNVTMLPDVAALATDQAATEQDKESLIETAEREEWTLDKIGNDFKDRRTDLLSVFCTTNF